MILSTRLLRAASIRFLESKQRLKKVKTEQYAQRISPDDSAGAGVAAAFDTFLLAVAILFFVLELMLLIFAINIAFKCSSTVEERVVHVTLACIFTLPYILGMILLNPCARAVLSRSSASGQPAYANQLI
jgi:NADH:ubiquinone oxidoreductase subunit 3 (subunit A)